MKRIPCLRLVVICCLSCVLLVANVGCSRQDEGASGSAGGTSVEATDSAQSAGGESPDGAASLPDLIHSQEDGTIALVKNGTELARIAAQTIESYPSVDRRVVIDSTSGNETCDFSGTALSNVLAPWKGTYQSVRLRGVDGYVIEISAEEALAENKAFLMYKNRGEPLPKADGGEGAYRLVMVGDDFGQRFVNYVVQIDLLDSVSGG